MSSAHEESSAKSGGAAVSVVGILIEASVVMLLVVLLLEGASRLVHGGVRPMLPSVADDSLSPRMPPLFDSQVQFSNSPAFTVCTDEDGMRGNRCGPRHAPPQVLTVGDSQAFGWAMDFSSTFTTKVAGALGEKGPDAARAMAVAGADVESLLGWARDYRRHVTPSQPMGHLNIVVVNLGNDLDEMYFNRASGEVPRMKAAREWLTVHSFSILDYNLLKAKFSATGQWTLPPGANPVVLALTSAEREQLALGTAAASLRLVQALPPAQKTVVMLLPNDYQVAPSEFAKYRPFYQTQEQFDGWQKRVDVAAADLDQIELQIAQALRREGVTVDMPRQRLASYDPLKILDRRSHHYTAFGQSVLADSILDAIGQPSAHVALIPTTKANQ